jgi:hypothetical protein
MTQSKTVIPLEIDAADLADLEEWARNSESSVPELLQEALQQYLRYARADIADLDRRMAGPEIEHEEAMRMLAERRRQWRGSGRIVWAVQRGRGRPSQGHRLAFACGQE